MCVTQQAVRVGSRHSRMRLWGWPARMVTALVAWVVKALVVGVVKAQVEARAKTGRLAQVESLGWAAWEGLVANP